MASWASPPFHAALKTLRKIDRILHLSIEGIDHISRMVPLAEALTELDRKKDQALDPDALDHLQRTRERAEFAAEEIDNGFATLHAHAVISMWGLLEAVIEDVAVTFLKHEPHLRHSKKLARLKMPLAEYDELDDDEKLRFLVTEYARTQAAPLKQGVSRFEIVLALVDMSGPVNDQTRQDLFEFGHIRNVLVHRAAVADRRLINACPWLALQPGNELQITHRDYQRYCTALQTYLTDLVHRATAYHAALPNNAQPQLSPAPSPEQDAAD